MFSSISYIVYIGCCSQNWLYQLYFLATYKNIPLIDRVAYGGIITSIVYDDWVLIKYLKDKSSKNHFSFSKDC